ncbi:MAG: DNA-deoxyinosine glycosylase [Clostridia bacterium]|nr:DNA-deoxyinosine glycosylase [Clostridia bacterium]
MIVHPIPPLFGEDSKTLILGSFPSVKSREAAFFYGHPQNRFWAVIAEVLGYDKPKNIEEKKKLILENRLALWDVIASCEIEGSADSTINNVTANDLSIILENSRVDRILVNGKTAEKYYNKYTYPKTGIKAVCLPSTSPANAAWSIERLIEAWKIIIE